MNGGKEGEERRGRELRSRDKERRPRREGFSYLNMTSLTQYVSKQAGEKALENSSVWMDKRETKWVGWIRDPTRSNPFV